VVMSVVPKAPQAQETSGTKAGDDGEWGGPDRPTRSVMP
jgi:hypothetical protein